MRWWAISTLVRYHGWRLMTAGPDLCLKPLSHSGPTRRPEPPAPGCCSSVDTPPHCGCWREASDAEGRELGRREFPPVHATSDKKIATARYTRTPSSDSAHLVKPQGFWNARRARPVYET